MKGKNEDSSAVPDYDELAEFTGDPGTFWNRVCVFVRTQMESESACLLLPGSGDQSEIRVLAQFPAGVAQRLAKGGIKLDDLPAEVDQFAPLHGPLGKSFRSLFLSGREGLPSTWVLVENAHQEADGQTVATKVKT